MTYKITTRIVPAVILLSLLGTGVAQAFCFMKNHDRRANFSNNRMPAIGFSPAALEGYQVSPVQPGWYVYPTALPQQLPYDSRYDVDSGLQH